MTREQWLPVQAAFRFPSANHKQDLSKAEPDAMAKRFLQATQVAASAPRGGSSSIMGTSIMVAHCWVTTKTLTGKKQVFLRYLQYMKI